MIRGRVFRRFFCTTQQSFVDKLEGIVRLRMGLGEGDDPGEMDAKPKDVAEELSRVVRGLDDRELAAARVLDLLGTQDGFSDECVDGLRGILGGMDERVLEGMLFCLQYMTPSADGLSEATLRHFFKVAVEAAPDQATRGAAGVPIFDALRQKGIALGPDDIGRYLAMRDRAVSPRDVADEYSLLDMLASYGDVEAVRARMEAMEARGEPLGTHHRVTLLEALCNSSRFEEAEAELEVHEDDHIRFGLGIGFRLVADTARANGLGDLADGLEAKMRALNVPVTPDESTQLSQEEVEEMVIQAERAQAEKDAYDEADAADRLQIVRDALPPRQRLRSMENESVMAYMLSFNHKHGVPS